MTLRIVFGFSLIGRIDGEDAQRTQRTIAAEGGAAKVCVADVSLEDEAERMVRETMAAYGRIDLLINDAGVAIGGSVVELP
jgi:NAD(P)-dependent dehydrogenase (short-subunit alcohol dehydrogenase family)